jgi:hypothetical protein
MATHDKPVSGHKNYKRGPWSRWNSADCVVKNLNLFLTDLLSEWGSMGKEEADVEGLGKGGKGGRGDLCLSFLDCTHFRSYFPYLMPHIPAVSGATQLFRTQSYSHN